MKYYLFTDGFGLSDKPEERLRRHEARYDRERWVRVRFSRPHEKRQPLLEKIQMPRSIS